MAVPSDDVGPDTSAPLHTTTSRTRSSPQRGGSTNVSRSVTAYVVESGGPCNCYRWDPERSIPVLDGVLHPAHARGVDLARVPLLPPPPSRGRTPSETPRHRASWIEPLVDDPERELLAGLGPSLLVLVVAHLSNPPGTQLTIRLLGAARIGSGPMQQSADGANVSGASGTHAPDQRDPLAGEDNRTHDTGDGLSEWIAIAVPSADPTLAKVERISDLPNALRQRLERALVPLTEARDSTGVTFPELASVRGSGGWLSAEQVMARLREARARGRLEARASDAAEREHLRERLYAAPTESAGTIDVDEAFRKRLTRDTAAPAAEAAPATQSPAQPRVQQPATPPASGTWHEITPVSPAELRARGAAVYGEAAHLARWIPARYGRYLSELLLPDERVIFFAECPPLIIRGWTGGVTLGDGASGSDGDSTSSLRSSSRIVGRALQRLRTRHLQSGIFIITDRQALLLRDYAAPDATIVQWGYIAHSIPLARLLAVRIVPAHSARRSTSVAALTSWPASIGDGRPLGIARYDEATVPEQFARILLALEGANGIEVTGVAFPPESLSVLERAAVLLERFMPLQGAAGANDRRVRLVHTVDAWKPTQREAAELESLGGLVTPEVSEALEAATREALRPGESVLAQARTPSMQEASADTAALLTLTSTRLLIAQSAASAGPRHSPRPQRDAHSASAPVTLQHPSVDVHELPLGACTSVTLQHSLLGCGFTCAVPIRALANGQHIETIHIAFPSPLIVPFRALYTRLRLLLANMPATPAKRW